LGVRGSIHDGVVETRESPSALEELAFGIRACSWELAVATVEEGLLDDQIPSLQRLGRLGQLGDMPTFIAELAQELADPQPERVRHGSPLAAQAREHARQREAFGFAPREIVSEFLLLRRILWRFVAERAAELDPGEMLAAEERLNAAVDRLVTECVVAYFDRATSELAHQARHDQLTGLLHHQAFVRELELELERARRYGHGVALVFIDLDRFKELNDTLGHPEGDRALTRFSALLRDSLRGSDLAGRMGGDEFAAYLVEADEEAGSRLLERLRDRVDELVAAGELPEPCAFSAGLAHFPDEAGDADALFRAADARLYEAKRASAA
jgi:diguanylate cyclase (GGDEF)-like protein